MRVIIGISLIVLLYSCSPRDNKVYPNKYHKGQMVVVNGQIFVVEEEAYDFYKPETKVYSLQKFDCKEKYCMFDILENEIQSFQPTK